MYKMILRNSKGFLQMYKMFMLVEQGNVMIAQRENKEMWWLKQSSLMESTTNYWVLQRESFYTGLCSVRHFPSTIINSWYYLVPIALRCHMCNWHDAIVVHFVVLWHLSTVTFLWLQSQGVHLIAIIIITCTLLEIHITMVETVKKKWGMFKVPDLF